MLIYKYQCNITSLEDTEMVVLSPIFLLANIEASQEKGFLDVGLPHVKICPKLKAARLLRILRITQGCLVGWVPYFFTNKSH